jgi:hypothetical protein
MIIIAPYCKQGFCDTVEHEVDGFLFNPGDAADASRFANVFRQ